MIRLLPVSVDIDQTHLHSLSCTCHGQGVEEVHSGGDVGKARRVHPLHTHRVIPHANLIGIRARLNTHLHRGGRGGGARPASGEEKGGLGTLYTYMH